MLTRRMALYGIEEVLRSRHECGRSQREIARTYGLAVGAVNQLQLRESLPERSRASLSTAQFSTYKLSAGKPHAGFEP